MTLGDKAGLDGRASGINDSVLDTDFTKKFKNDSQSMFTKAFIDDCILIFRELKKAPRMIKKKFSISLKSQGPLSSTADEMNKTQNTMNSSPDAKQVGKATFIGLKSASPGIDKNGVGSSPMESPRNQRYQSVNEFKLYSEAIDKHLEQIRQI